ALLLPLVPIGYHVTLLTNATAPAARKPQLQSNSNRTPTLSDCQSERTGAAMVFGLPGVPIGNGVVSSMCNVACALGSKRGSGSAPTASALTAIHMTVPAAMPLDARTGNFALKSGPARNTSVMACVGGAMKTICKPATPATAAASALTSVNIAMSPPPVVAVSPVTPLRKPAG